MTAVKLKDIPDVMVEKLKILQRSIDSADISKQDLVIKDLRKQIKEIIAITQQGEVAIGMNREKLAKVSFLANHNPRNGINWDNCSQDLRNWYLNVADAIIKAQPTLIERVKE